MSKGIEIICGANGLQTIIDAEDAEYVMQFKWFAKKCRSVIYAARSIRCGSCVDTVYMHRVLTKCPKGYEVHHKNGDTLDNRKGNLLVCRKVDNVRMNHR